MVIGVQGAANWQHIKSANYQLATLKYANYQLATLKYANYQLAIHKICQLSIGNTLNMKRSGAADLALMGGSIPPWLFDRMVKLSLAVVESIVTEYGQQEFLRRLSDPFWFQSFGAVICMDWNSSGVTAAVMSALKKSLNPHSKSLGLYVCGGKGKRSLLTPNELVEVGLKTTKSTFQNLKK